MATVNFIPYRRQSATALSRVAEYVSQKHKTLDEQSRTQLVSGISCSPQFAVQEFRVARAAHHKESPVWFYHYTQSLSPGESVTGQQAHEMAKVFAEQAWPDSQILVATHVDAHHIHSHFIVNAVCHESGYMLRQGPTTLKRLRKLSDEICQAHGLSILPSNPPKHSKEPGTREYRSMEKNESWKMQLMLTIEDAMAVARSREHFIKLLKQKGYQVKWTDERKSITYTTPGGMKCRDNKLHEDKFLKGAMEYESKLREEIIRRIEESDPAADARGAGSSALRHRDREELGGYAWTTAVTATDVGGDSVSSGTAGHQGRIAGISGQPGAGIGELCAGDTGGNAGFSAGDGKHSFRDGEEIILTGWEDERQLFTQSLLGTRADEEIFNPAVLDIADTFGGAGDFGTDLAYLAGDLAGIIDENYHPQDSTTMRTPRRRKRAPGQKPDEHDYEQKM